jgi:alpha-tubulin suppressor-like RCC1 family protein
MERIGMARIALTVAVVAAGLAYQVVSAGAVANLAGSRAVRPAIAVGNSHSCVLLPNGWAKCWGNDGNGQLGNGTTTFSSPPVVVSRLTNAVSISAGGANSCALLANATAKCWGNNVDGELGNGATADSSIPVLVSGLTNAVAIFVGGNHSCAVLVNGTVECWGKNDSGQLGNGTTTNSSIPVVVSGLTSAVAVSASYGHSCALLANGTAKCWGNNSNYQLGNGTTTSSSTPVVVSGLTSAVAITAGYIYSCALLANGTAKCWGNNTNHQLGNGTTDQAGTPVPVSGLANAVAISAGSNTACALLANGTAKCWGFNGDGELGNGTTTGSSTPVVVSGLANAVALSAGEVSACVLLANGTAKCWGGNFFGQLGNGTTTNSSTPVVVSGLSSGTKAVAITAGGSNACGLLANGTAKCWGYNFRGGLGDGTTTDSLTPVVVSGLTTAVAISSGAEYGPACALLANGTAKCWGPNDTGQLGVGTFSGPEQCGGTPCSTTPAAVSGLTNAVAISAGGDHACALLVDGSARCWGGDYFGELGDGIILHCTSCASSAPVVVKGLANAVAISAGTAHSCALLANGTAKCWGDNESGQLGNGTTTSSSMPVVVSGLFSAVAISVGEGHSCALLSNGWAKCWGDNQAFGELGNGTTTNSSIPVVVKGLTTAVAITTGINHSCGVLANGTAKCWGANLNGELGDGTFTGSGQCGNNPCRTTPVAVSGLATAVAISGGLYASCALLANGTAKCWGNNDSGQLGDGTTTESSTPVVVMGI